MSSYCYTIITHDTYTNSLEYRNVNIVYHIIRALWSTCCSTKNTISVFSSSSVFFFFLYFMMAKKKANTKTRRSSFWCFLLSSYIFIHIGLTILINGMLQIELTFILLVPLKLVAVSNLHEIRHFLPNKYQRDKHCAGRDRFSFLKNKSDVFQQLKIFLRIESHICIMMLVILPSKHCNEWW